MLQLVGKNPSRETQNRLLAAIEYRLSETHSLEGIIEVVRASARALCGADGATFVLREGNQCYYVEENAISPLWKGQRFPMDSCISGWCMKNAQTVWIEDVYSDPRIPHDVYRKTFVKSMIMTPVMSGSAIAAIGAYWAARCEFTQDDVWAVEALANAVANAMNAARAA